MSEKILIIDLNNSSAETLSYSYDAEKVYGRGLVLDLFRRFVPDGAERYSDENIIAIVPGFFAGNPAPSACRMLVATIENHERGIQISNTTGNMPQKLGSLGIAGIVIRGRAQERGTVIHIHSGGVDFSSGTDFNDAHVSEIVSGLRAKYGRDCAVIGSGIAGDMRMTLSSFFCTYPEGEPAYHSPRSGFGDVWGAKNLRAVVVTCNDYFGRECDDPERFRSLGRKLTQIIINDEMCGGALPAYGSTAIMKVLKSEDRIPYVPAEPVAEMKIDKIGRSLNRTCAPMCVIGCLNRHTAGNGLVYSSPAQVETQAAIENCFGTDDFDLSAEVQNRATEIGIVATEFVTACKVYAEAENIRNGEQYLLRWLDEIEAGSMAGRVIASRTAGISSLYPDKDLHGWIDRKAIEDEILFDLKLNTRYPGLPHLDEKQLLYTQVFVLENLGFCIFTSSALLDKAETFELLAEMFEARTGSEMSGEKLLLQADQVIRGEKEFSEHRWRQAQKSSVPPFTKVLYRYFGVRREE